MLLNSLVAVQGSVQDILTRAFLRYKAVLRFENSIHTWFPVHGESI